MFGRDIFLKPCSLNPINVFQECYFIQLVTKIDTNGDKRFVICDHTFSLPFQFW